VHDEEPPFTEMVRLTSPKVAGSPEPSPIDDEQGRLLTTTAAGSVPTPGPMSMAQLRKVRLVS
jgi:hypothetical protein